MKFYQKKIRLSPQKRGYHLITEEVLCSFKELENITVGQLHVFLKHTSASLTINENADPTVRQDFETHINKMIPEDCEYYTHTYEGSDDMPAHIKASMLGNSLAIPITNGSLNLGMWQGIYLGEHRNYGGSRYVVLTAFGS